MATRLIFGCGYLGARVARRWVERGDRVVAVTRRAERVATLRAAGVEPLVADVTRPETLGDLPAADSLLYAVGYDRTAAPSIHEVYADGLRHALEAAPDSVRRVVYVSTTGVYGDASGGWVDEQTAPAPAREGGAASLAAERLLGQSGWAERSVALRLAGIYGPDRVPYVAALRAGEPIAAPQDGWLNLIHVDDAATAVLAATDADAPPPVVCVSDGAPPRRGDYYAEAARRLGAPAPRFVDPPPGSPRAARAAADKRVRNGLMTTELGVRLCYPTHREGLAAILGG